MDCVDRRYLWLFLLLHLSFFTNGLETSDALHTEVYHHPQRWPPEPVPFLQETCLPYTLKCTTTPRGDLWTSDELHKEPLLVPICWGWISTTLRANAILNYLVLRRNCKLRTTGASIRIRPIAETSEKHHRRGKSTGTGTIFLPGTSYKNSAKRIFVQGTRYKYIGRPNGKVKTWPKGKVPVPVQFLYQVPPTTHFCTRYKVQIFGL
jgi:hypothetical protein